MQKAESGAGKEGAADAPAPASGDVTEVRMWAIIFEEGAHSRRLWNRGNRYSRAEWRSNNSNTFVGDSLFV